MKNCITDESFNGKSIFKVTLPEVLAIQILHPRACLFWIKKLPAGLLIRYTWFYKSDLNGSITEADDFGKYLASLNIWISN